MDMAIERMWSVDVTVSTIITLTLRIFVDKDIGLLDMITYGVEYDNARLLGEDIRWYRFYSIYREGVIG